MGLKEDVEKALTTAGLITLVVQIDERSFVIDDVQEASDRRAKNTTEQFGHGGYAGKSLIEKIKEQREVWESEGEHEMVQAFDISIRILETGS